MISYSPKEGTMVYQFHKFNGKGNANQHRINVMSHQPSFFLILADHALQGSLGGAIKFKHPK